MENTALTFVFLFLITLFYCIGATIVKVNQQAVVKPNVTVMSNKDKNNIKLSCLLDGFYPDTNTIVTWLQDEKPYKGTTVEKSFKSHSPGEEGKTKAETFTRISEINVDEMQMNPDTKYTCQASHDKQIYIVSWNSWDESKLECSSYVHAAYFICVPLTSLSESCTFKTLCSPELNDLISASSCGTPLIQLEKPRLSDPSLKKNSSVNASCVVEAAPNSIVSWFLNGSVEISKTTEETPSRKVILSNLILLAEEWERYQTVTCSVQQPCDKKHYNKTVPFLESVASAPVVEIRRPLNGHGDVLECSARGLPSGEHSVTFQANTTPLQKVQNVDLPNGQHALTTQITIPKEYNDAKYTFTCSVRQSPTKQWNSKPTGNIFGNPSAEVSVVPRKEKSEPQNLLCTVTGFKPEIKWLSDSGTGTDVSSETMMQADGRVKVSSVIKLRLEEWNQGKQYTCEFTDLGKTYQKMTSVCEACPPAPVVIRLEKPRLASLKADSEKAEASCFVEPAPPNTEVSWLLNEKVVSDGVRNKRDENNALLSSYLILSGGEWEQHKTVTCRAKQPCDKNPVEKTVDVLEPTMTSPTVEIRRPLAHVPKVDGAILECFAKGLPSGELSVIFQANQTRFGEVQDMNLPKGQNYLTTQISIPVQYRNRDYRFICSVRQSPNKQWSSEPTGNIFDDPSVEILVVPRTENLKSNQQKLLCIVTGFNPKVSWTSKSGDKDGVSTAAMMQADGRVKVSSEMKVPLREWNNGKDFFCHVSDLQKSKQKKISDCAVTAPYAQMALVYLLGPSVNDMMSADSVPLTCLVIGYNVKDFSFTWKVNMTIRSKGTTQDPPKDHANGTQSVQSILKLPVAIWNTHSLVSCEVTHRCSNKTQQTREIIKVREPRPPTVRILTPSDSDLSGSSKATLLCLVTGFYPADISVHWKLNEKKLDVSRFTNSPVASAGQDYSMHSALTLLASEHERGTFSCIVNHESSQNPIISTLDNLYASVTNSSPSVELLQGRNDLLVCLVSNYSPSAINITWLLDGVTIKHKYNITSPAKGPDGKFSVRSQLQVLPSEWAPGSAYTCRVVHITGPFNCTISKAEIIDQTIYFDENLTEATAEDMAADTWSMACAFIALFLLSIVYGCSVTLVRVKIE
ncbi:hypothetical protein NFI96_028151 [Prochilodus magdalenae]|nr:hypothetical protein NFI96_028151 [Prochilodus magdalenae]